MSTDVIVYVLTALAAVVVVLTRLRLARDEGAGRAKVPGGVVLGHTVAGVLALLIWVPFLVFPEDSFIGSPLVGIIGLGFWWVTAIFGLLILMRWLPSRGRHAVDASSDSWSEGPGLSVLAHVGMVVAVAIFTFAYLTSAV
ncbi:hypothetical protein DDE18_16405 [Nocardioides gansuensis]|uniref:Uncharacterized protein n=1 Tax=Nocardioides gansuensis TaxID=2138300 RepID=A0A2T8F7B8_9ACTN|nr:hypothetical protein [Nocardioides gansuensis]PVG81589.1 hypothetical protein DDE18_16405 [Nocardioides gansuensis]